MLTLKQKYKTKKSIEGVSSVLNNSYVDDFEIIKMSEWCFKCINKVSYGTLIINNIPSTIEGIKIYIDLDYEDENSTSIILHTHPRLELYIVFLIWIIVAIAGITMEVIPFWISFTFPPIIVLLWLTFRIQEKSLMKKVEKHMKNVL